MRELAGVAPVPGKPVPGKIEIYCDGTMIWDDGIEPIPRSET